LRARFSSTEEMALTVAAPAKSWSPSSYRKEVAEWPHAYSAISTIRLEPMAIGRGLEVKINANIGTRDRIDVDEELRKLHTQSTSARDTGYGTSPRAATSPMIREQILRHSPVHRHRPLYEALARRQEAEDLNIELYLRLIRGAGAAGRRLLHPTPAVPHPIVPMGRSA